MAGCHRTKAGATYQASTRKTNPDAIPRRLKVVSQQPELFAERPASGALDVTGEHLVEECQRLKRDGLWIYAIDCRGGGSYRLHYRGVRSEKGARSSLVCSTESTSTIQKALSLANFPLVKTFKSDELATVMASFNDNVSLCVE